MNISKYFRGFQLAALSAALALAAIPGGTALAQTAAKDADNDKAVEQIVITGTRRVDRTVTDSASPVDIISSAELRSQPAANLMDQIKNVVPSFFVGQNTISDASSIVRAPSLRGLPSDEILVMLNGKRFNRSALVQVYTGGDTELAFGSQGSDISSIPSIAIKSLEVLRDGATAQYGSDAIAGVFNYGLRDDAGLELQARYGQYQDHGDGKSYQYAANGGIKNFLGTSGFANLSAEYSDDGQTSRGVTRPIAVAFAQDFPALASQLPNYPLPAQIWGQSPTHGYKLLLNAGFDVNDNARIYLFGNVAYNKVNESFNFRSSYPGSVPFTTVGGVAGGTVTAGGRSFFRHPYYQTRCPGNNATCPADGYIQDTNVFLLSSIYPGGFTPRFVGESDQAYGTLGYKGKSSSGLGYDFSISSSNNTVDLSMYSSISPSFGSASKTSFEFGKLIQRETDANIDLTYPIDAGMASPLTLSGGAEFRREEYTATPGDFQSYGSGAYAAPHPLFVETGTPGVFTPALDGNGAPLFTAAESPAASGYGGTSPKYAGTNSDSSYGVYVGLEGDVLKQLSMGVAGRYEKYDSSGAATVGKFNTIWHVTDKVALRATVGTGFHAPSPGQNNVQVLTTSFSQGVSLQQGTFPVTSTVAQFYGAKALKPEKSTNYGVGIVLQPTSAITATIDVYDIKVSDRIFISKSYPVSAQDIIDLPELAGVGQGGTVQYFTNALDTTTKGVDLVGTWRTTVADGRLNVSLAYNYNKSEATKYDPAVINTFQVIDIERLAPNHRMTLSGSWSRGNLGVNLRGNYYGAWVDANDYPTAFDTNGNVTAGQEFGAKFTVDFDASYTFKEHYTASIGASNLFNTYPDKILSTDTNPIATLTGGTFDGQVYPRNGGPFGVNGGFLYASLRFKY